MIDDLPRDPFGIDEAERLVWVAFRDTGAAECLLAIHEPARVARERAILHDRVDGIGRTGSLWMVQTLHYFLPRANIPTEAVDEALVRWRTRVARRDPFMTGRCHEFALAAHELTGWQIKLITGADDHDHLWPGRVMHVVIACPDGNVLDAMGLRPPQAVVDWYGRPQEAWLDVTPMDLMARTDLRPFADLEEARAAFAVVTGGLDVLADEPAGALGPG